MQMLLNNMKLKFGLLKGFYFKFFRVVKYTMIFIMPIGLSLTLLELFLFFKLASKWWAVPSELARLVRLSEPCSSVTKYLNALNYLTATNNEWVKPLHWGNSSKKPHLVHRKQSWASFEAAVVVNSIKG